VNELFAGNSFGYSPGVLGCAMSHLLVWRELALSPHATSFMVLEDDARLVEDFAEKWPVVMDQIASTDPSWDIVYLGMHGIEKETFVHPADEVHEHFLRLAAVPNHEGSGTHGYAISRAGAIKFLSFAWTRHIKEQIDMFMMAALTYNAHMHVTRPALALAAAWTANNEFGESDSDVQTELYAWANAASAETCIFVTFDSKLGIQFGEAEGVVFCEAVIPESAAEKQHVRDGMILKILHGTRVFTIGEVSDILRQGIRPLNALFCSPQPRKQRTDQSCEAPDDNELSEEDHWV
jgi:GR25 family glycosyltransferase involved in LPS biosynthesis